MSPRVRLAAVLLALFVAGAVVPSALAQDEETWADGADDADDDPVPVLDWPSRPVTYRGFVEGNGGVFARGTVTLSPDAVVSRTRRLFREESSNDWHAPISTFRAHVGLLQGRIEFCLVDGGMVVLVMPRTDARALASTLATASVRPQPESASKPRPPPRRPTITTTTVTEQ